MTAMTTTTERTEPSTTDDERGMLEGWLDFHRETLALKCAGLSDEQLRRKPIAPSGLSLLGLVRHLAEVERGWFRHVLADECEETIYCEQDPDGDFHVGDEDTYAQAYATWQAEIARARELAAAHGLDDLAVGKSRSGKDFNLRWIMTHMIEEYARHNGHADLLRECVDGTTGE
ncbi:DinB family protein [Streptomyces sp. NPDC051907]|uniref:DinB family protein n=1 Tax=Streptomyces sp. NPDC051907 TaxID=3155284 RepID=UPI003431F6CC